MAVSDDYAAYVVDQLSGWGEVTVRKMFGGAGLYRDGIMFGLIADDMAYFKVDDSNRSDYEAAGSSQFIPFPDKPNPMPMPYYDVPADVLESPLELAEWADKALAVARAKKAARAKKGKRR